MPINVQSDLTTWDDYCLQSRNLANILQYQVNALCHTWSPMEKVILLHQNFSYSHVIGCIIYAYLYCILHPKLLHRIIKGTGNAFNISLMGGFINGVQIERISWWINQKTDDASSLLISLTIKYESATLHAPFKLMFFTHLIETTNNNISKNLENTNESSSIEQSQTSIEESYNN